MGADQCGVPGCDWRSNTNTYSNTQSHSYTNIYANAHTYSDTQSHSYANIYANTHTYFDPHTYTNSNSNPQSDTGRAGPQPLNSDARSDR